MQVNGLIMKRDAIYKYIRSVELARALLAVLILMDGLWMVVPLLFKQNVRALEHHLDFAKWIQSFDALRLLDIPQFAIGILFIILAFPVYRGLRIGWLFSSFMLFIVVLMNLLLARENVMIGTFSLILLIYALVNWKLFHRHSISGAGFVAIVSLAALLGFSVFGTLYLGTHFQPHVTDISSAFYFALVCMTTVGFGDIVPISVEARLFTVSIVILGITMFTTSIVYVLGVFAKDTRAIVGKRLFRMKDHYVIVGASPLSLHTYYGLRKRDLNVMVLCREAEKDRYPAGINIVTAEQVNKESLNKVNLSSAKAVFVLGNSDAENILTVLAAKELVGANIKSILLVNDDQNYDNMKLLHPDLLISLSTLGSEVLLKMLFGESIDNQIMENLLFSNNILES